jgi:ABC-type sugar transport system substrate-binding protein
MGTTVGVGSVSQAACRAGYQATSGSPVSGGNARNAAITLILGQTIDPFYITMASIKVISVDTFIGNGDYVHGPVTFPLSYIGSDNLNGGRIVGDVLIKSISGEGKIYFQDTTSGTSSTAQRVQGCKQAIAATNGAVTLVGVDYNYHNVPKSTAKTQAIIQKAAIYVNN